MDKYPILTKFDPALRRRLFHVCGIIAGLILGLCFIGCGSTFAVLSSSSSVGSNQPSVKIIFPHRGQEVSIAGNMTVLGISSPPAAEKTRNDCTVSVIINGIKPYQKAFPTGYGGTIDYSRWRYDINHTSAAFKPGQNKITSKISCSATPTNLTKFDSVNVTGVGTPLSVNGQNGKNGSNGANGTSSGGNGGIAYGGNGGNGGNGGSANGGNGGLANGGNGGLANGGNGGSALVGHEGSAVGGNGGNGGNGGPANGMNSSSR